MTTSDAARRPCAGGCGCIRIFENTRLNAERKGTRRLEAEAGNLEHLLPDPKAIHKPEPHASLHYEEIAGFMRVLRAMDRMEFRGQSLTPLLPGGRCP